MSDENMGKIGWLDLTVDDADNVAGFYEHVAGWRRDPVPMDGGQYNDFNMIAGEGGPVAGVCHARGPNAGLPPQWMIYITVPDLAAALSACEANGGSVVRQPDAPGSGTFGVVRDPAGAFCALYQP